MRIAVHIQGARVIVGEGELSSSHHASAQQQRAHAASHATFGATTTVHNTQQQVAILHIYDLPAALRADVEKQLDAALQSQPMDALPGTDPLDITWCTRWERAGHRLVRCRQPLNGLEEEFRALETGLRAIGAHFTLERIHT